MYRKLGKAFEQLHGRFQRANKECVIDYGYFAADVHGLLRAEGIGKARYKSTKTIVWKESDERVRIEIYAEKVGQGESTISKNWDWHRQYGAVLKVQAITETVSQCNRNRIICMCSSVAFVKILNVGNGGRVYHQLAARLVRRVIFRTNQTVQKNHSIWL